MSKTVLYSWHGWEVRIDEAEPDVELSSMVIEYTDWTGAPQLVRFVLPFGPADLDWLKKQVGGLKVNNRDVSP